MIGTSLNHYRITAIIGAGGMGEVFRARDTRLNRDVTVKVLPKDFVADADRLRHFEQEAKTLAALNHPNVLTVHDAGVHEGAPYLVSELLEGKTVREDMNGAALPVRKAGPRAANCAWTCSRARQKRRSSRPQAGEHLRHQGWAREDSGFWIGETQNPGVSSSGSIPRTLSSRSASRPTGSSSPLPCGNSSSAS